jgi:LDH2 family malate/lactate/ureidoglycolate dehydrogenase
MSARDAARRLAAVYRDSGARWAASLVADRMLPLGTMRFWHDVPVSLATLRRQVDAILTTWGMPERARATTLDHLLYADLHGIDSHGCAMLRSYQRDRASGAWRADATTSVVHESGGTALIDGGGGLGHVPADTAMRLAMAKAAEHGVAAVAVRNSGHFGAAGSYAALAAREGMIGIATTGTRVPSLVPTAARDAALGTNPIAFAAPISGQNPFLLDMATSTAPLGRLGLAAHRGHRIPRGWALDPAGRTETNARRAIDARRLTPLGGSLLHGSHKGYGLATMVEILSAVLPGTFRANPVDGDVPTVGHFFLCLDPRRFRGADAFASDLGALAGRLRELPPVVSDVPVQVAGDPEHATATRRTRDGIPLARSVVEDIRHVARAAGAPFLLPA